MAANTKRLFFAVDPGGAARVALDRLVRELRQSAGPGLGAARWTEPERLHLTLQFLARVPVDQVAALSALGTRLAASQPAFDVRLGGLGAFPSLGRARVLWLGVEGGAASLGQLAAALGAGLVALGLPIEERAFTPHLTLARLKTPASCRALRDRVPVPDGLVFRARELVLYESQLGAGPARYVPLHRAPFA
jgi:2'-5' RNA ligase